MNCLVSVIVPVFNTGKKAVKIIQQLLDGEYKNIEIIVVDDGSSDDSLGVLEKEFKKNKKVRIFHQVNKGVSAARNLGIEKAEGELVVFADSDDEVKRSYVASMVKSMEDGVGLVVARAEQKDINGKKTRLYVKNVYFGEKGEKIKKKDILIALLADGRLYPIWNKMFRKKIIDKNKLKFDKKMVFAEDLKFVLQYLGGMDGGVAMVEKASYVYNYGNEGAIRKVAKEQNNWKMSYQFLKEWVGLEVGVEERLLLGAIWARWKMSWLKKKILRK